ncbi:hypothetical protein [Tunturiibacter gelidoferens]|uniref:Uncharacterized protein n=1 Tax=Tunturiibacter gelidiferens TaxID=3069689 RepID=A0A9X0QCE9_9BACT|nr:hypothetical protein [Edaphobacter lichenicola]MBB5327946.1 hypothetical protein [Edaphobacter lichenicola]
MRSVTIAILLCFSLITHAQAPLFSKWVAVFKKFDNGEDNKLFLELHQHGTTLKCHFHTLGYGGDLSGTIEKGHFVLFAPLDKIKPFCTGKVSGGDLSIDLGWGGPFMVRPETPADVPAPPVYLAPPALHKVGSNGLAKTPPMGWNNWNSSAAASTMPWCLRSPMRSSRTA